MRKLLIILALNTALFCLVFQACKKDKPAKQTSSPNQLSYFGVFSGTMANLTPSSKFHLYNIASTLFTDYAEKQRLIKIPPGTKLQTQGDGLLEFPDGTVIAKTFYYYNDVSNPSLGKRIIETRLLQLNNGVWSVSTFKWRDDQSDADLVKDTGDTLAVSWKDVTGTTRNINYQIPAIADCKTCHDSGGNVIPIGLKARNMNFNTVVNGNSVNQLAYLSSLNILSYSGTITSVPDYNDATADLSARARAYLDINCAHCHNTNGSASSARVHFDYDLTLDQTGISSFKSGIISEMQTKRMPLIGTTIVHTEGLALITQYINSLP